MTQALKQTPFAAAYPDGVVEWIDVFGYAVPLTWGDPGAEYNAVRNAAAAMEFSMLMKWDVKGPAAMQTVNAIFSRDIAGMKAGRIAYGVIVNDEGMMVDDCTVFIHGPEHVRIFGANPQVGKFLDNHRSTNVSVTQCRDNLAQLSVQGPASREILQNMTDRDLSNEALSYYHFLTDVEMEGLNVQVSRIGFTGELGYEIMLPVSQAVEFWEALFQVGTSYGLLPAGAAAVMMCRIESGMIMGEVEYDHTMTPYECRMGWAVDLDKTDFLGKKALVQAKASAAQTIVSVVLPGEGEYDGAPLYVDGAQIGHVTMATPSPHLEGRLLGLARVTTGYSAVGTELQLDQQGNVATVVSMPVYDPDRRRVRS